LSHFKIFTNFILNSAKNKGHVETVFLCERNSSECYWKYVYVYIYIYIFLQVKYSDRSCVGKSGVHILFPRYSFKYQVLNAFEQKQSWRAKYQICTQLKSSVEHTDVQTLKTERYCDCVCTSLKWNTHVLLFHTECNSESYTYISVLISCSVSQNRNVWHFDNSCLFINYIPYFWLLVNQPIIKSEYFL
jgi:hypothetical protein